MKIFDKNIQCRLIKEEINTSKKKKNMNRRKAITNGKGTRNYKAISSQRN